MTKNKKDRFTVRLPKELNEKLEIVTNKMGISKNAYMLNLIIHELNKSNLLEESA